MTTDTSTTINTLRWHKFPVLNDGFITLVDVMGDDAAIVQAAKVSYGRDTRDGRSTNQSEIDNGTWSPDTAPDPTQAQKNRKLIRYLMRHRHTTPFEMAELKFLVRVPMDCWRQWIRHRTANVNEYSTRYTEAIDSCQQTAPNQWRSQAKSNKQGSGDFLPESTGATLSQTEEELQQQIRRVYESRIHSGVAKEQARKDLPLSTYTEAYWKIDLHNLLHFLSLRMDSHAQKEIRDYATIIGEKIVASLFPIVWEAFTDYRLGGLFLTRLDIEMIQTCQPPNRIWEEQTISSAKHQWEHLYKEPADKPSRERDESITKLQKLGLISH